MAQHTGPTETRAGALSSDEHEGALQGIRISRPSANAVLCGCQAFTVPLHRLPRERASKAAVISHLARLFLRVRLKLRLRELDYEFFAPGLCF